MNKKLGYYVCNGIEFQSKIECTLYATKVQQPVTWVFNNDVFDHYTWNVEPPGSVDDYYFRRARELREKYDYLVLNYSGGADSHNALMSFHRQGLYIDEIVTNWVFDASKKFTVEDTNITDAWNQNAEYELNAREKLQWIHDNMPNTKVSMYDCGNQIINYFAKADDENWVLDAIDATNVGAMARYNVLSIKNIRERFDHFKSIGVVVGIDKPRCVLDDNDNLYLVFFDKIANVVPVSRHLVDYTNTETEYFYWDPSCTDMIAKQAHTVLNFLKNNPGYKQCWRERAWNYRFTTEAVGKKIYYNTWDDKFQVTKPIQDWYTEYDYWFLDQLKATKPVANWKRGIDFLENNLDESFLISGVKSDPHDLIGKPQIKGMAAFSSPYYFIGKV